MLSYVNLINYYVLIVNGLNGLIIGNITRSLREAGLKYQPKLRRHLSSFFVIYLLLFLTIIAILPQFTFAQTYNKLTLHLEQDVYFKNLDANINMNGTTIASSSSIIINLFNETNSLKFSDETTSINYFWNYTHAFGVLDDGIYRVVVQEDIATCSSWFTYINTEDWVSASFPIQTIWKTINYTLYSNRTLFAQKNSDWLTLTFPTFNEFPNLEQTFTRNNMVFRTHLYKSGQLDCNLAFVLSHKGLKFYLNGTQNIPRSLNVKIESNQPLKKYLNTIMCGSLVFDFSDLQKTGVSFSYSNGILSINAGTDFFIDPELLSSGWESSGGSDITDGGVWTSSGNSGGSSSVVSSPVNSGNYAANISISSGNTWSSVYKDYGVGYSTIYARSYFMFSALPASGEHWNVGNTITNVGAVDDLVISALYNDAGTVKWELNYYTSGGQVYEYSATPSPEVATWYCVETKYVGASGTGEVGMWINGNLIISASGLTNNIAGDSTSFWMAIYHPSGAAFTMTVDDVVIDTSYIGPLAGGEAEDYVDNNTSNVDGSSDVGTHGNFTTQKYSDNINDTLTEAGIPTGYSNSTLLNDGFESGTGNWDGNGSPTFGRVTQYTASGETINPHGNSWFMVNEEKETDFLSSDDLDMSGATGIYISFWYYDDDLDSGELTLSYWDGAGYDLIAGLGQYTESQWNYYEVKVTDDTYFISDFHIRFDGSADNNEAGAIDDVIIIKESATSYNYKIDLEIQWTNANYSRTNEELCINTGAFSGAEDLMIYAWNVSTSDWHWVMNLTANTFNNVTVTSWLNNETFTVRLLGGLESGDTTQNTWNIEASLLHTWETAGNVENFYGGILSSVAIVGGKFVSYSTYCDVAPLLTIATQVSYNINKYAYANISLSLSIVSGRNIEVMKYHSVSPQYSLFSNNVWSLSRQGAVYQLSNVDGWLQALVELGLYGDIQPLIIVDSSLQFAVIKYGDMEIICQISTSKSSEFNVYLSVNPLFVIIGNYSEETLTIENIYATVGQILGINDYVLYVFESSGDINQNIAIATSKTVSLTKLMEILQQMGLNHITFNDLVKSIIINQDLTIGSLTLNDLMKVGVINEDFTIDGYSLKDLSKFGVINENVNINSIDFEALARTGLVNQNFNVQSIKWTLRNLNQFGAINLNYAITSTSLKELLRFGLINENIIIDGSYSTFSGLMFYGNLNLKLTLNQTTYKELARLGLILETFNINSVRVEELIKYLAANPQLGINTLTLEELLRYGTILENLSVETITFEDLIKAGIINETFLIDGNYVSFGALLIFGAINLNLTITDETLLMFEKLGLINEHLTINDLKMMGLNRNGILNNQFIVDGLTLKDLVTAGIINLDLTINNELYAELIRVGIINENFSINGLALKDLIRLGIIDENFILDNAKLYDLLKAGIINEELLINFQKAMSFNLFMDVGQSFSIVSALETLWGTILNFFGYIGELIGITATNNLPIMITQYLPVSRGLLFFAAIIGGASAVIIFKHRKNQAEPAYIQE